MLHEKALSKKQQRFFGIVRASQKGTLKGEASPQVQRAAASMKKKDVKKFASTKHKGLPEKKITKEETCGKGEYYCNDDQKCKPIPKGMKVEKDGYLVKKENVMLTYKSGQGVDASIGGRSVRNTINNIKTAKKTYDNIKSDGLVAGVKKTFNKNTPPKTSVSTNVGNAISQYKLNMGEGNLHKWFKGSKSKDGKGGWVNVKTGGTCASDEPGEGTPKCVSSSKRASMSKAERESASRRKKAADPNQQQKSGAAKPTYVSTDKPKKKMKESFSTNKYKEMAKREADLKRKEDLKVKTKKEETEVVTELKKSTYGSYIKKASTQMAISAMKGDDKKMKKRHKGVLDASDKLSKEDVEQIYEYSPNVSYQAKGGKKSGKLGKSSVYSLRDKDESKKDFRKSHTKDIKDGLLKKEEVVVESDKKGKGSGKKDACYHKVKASASVWPSAYASGRLVQCRKKGAANYGNSKKESYNNKSFSDFMDECWKTHKKVGMKMKGGKLVPDCRPKNEQVSVTNDGSKLSPLHVPGGSNSQFNADGSKKVNPKKFKLPGEKGRMDYMKKLNMGEAVETEKKPKKAMDAGARGRRLLKRREHQAKVSEFVPKELEDHVVYENPNTNLFPDGTQAKVKKVLDAGSKFIKTNPVGKVLGKVFGSKNSGSNYTKDGKVVADSYVPEASAAWQKKSGKNSKGGLNEKGRKSYEAQNPGSDLKAPVTGKVKAGGKAAKRRKSFCARMGGMKGPMKKPNGKPTRKALALRKWKC